MESRPFDQKQLGGYGEQGFLLRQLAHPQTGELAPFGPVFWRWEGLCRGSQSEYASTAAFRPLKPAGEYDKLLWAGLQAWSLNTVGALSDGYVRRTDETAYR